MRVAAIGNVAKTLKQSLLIRTMAKNRLFLYNETNKEKEAHPMKRTIRLNLTPTEANVLLHGLNELRNKWLEEGRDTYLVDEVFLHVIKKSEKKLRT